MSEIKKGGDALALSTDIHIITAEINAYQRIAGEAIFEIGYRLHNVKYNPRRYGLPVGKDKDHREIVARGAWGDWLTEMGIHPNVAHRTMSVFDELGRGKVATSPNKGLNVLYEIATLPPEERENEHTLKSGETKTPDEMTVRELREVKKALKEAKAREESERQLRQQAEQNYEGIRQAFESHGQQEPEVRYVEVADEESQRKVKRYEELFGDVSMYEGKTTRVTNGDAVTYTVFEFSEDVRKFIEKYGHLTHFAREFNVMIDEGQEEYREAIRTMQKFLASIEKNIGVKDAEIING